MADSLKTLLSGPVAASPQEARRWDTLECCHHFVGVAFKHQRAKIDFTMSWGQACPGVARASVLLSKKDKSLQKIFFFVLGVYSKFNIRNIFVDFRSFLITQ